MMLSPTPKSTGQVATKHRGFAADGSMFESELEVDNVTTRFVRFLLREIREEYLSPQDAHFLILKEGLSSAFPNHEAWSHLARFWMWPLAVGSTSVEEVVRSLGGKYPWLKDEYAWKSWCDAAEARYGHESRYAGIPEMPRSSDPG